MYLGKYIGAEIVISQYVCVCFIFIFDLPNEENLLDV